MDGLHDVSSSYKVWFSRWRETMPFLGQDLWGRPFGPEELDGKRRGLILSLLLKLQILILYDPPSQYALAYAR